MDRRIPFSDLAVWPYLSLYLFVPAGPFLLGRRNQILRYAAGIILISLVADIIFIFWPTTCPRPVVSDANAAYQALTAVDNTFHAFPSLHAAFAVYAALSTRLILRELGGRGGWQFAIWLWVFMILYATLASKQHVLADIIAGSALGIGVYAVVFNQGKPIAKGKPS